MGYSPWGRKETDTTEPLHFHFHTVPMNVLKTSGLGALNELYAIELYFDEAVIIFKKVQYLGFPWQTSG